MKVVGHIYVKAILSIQDINVRWPTDALSGCWRFDIDHVLWYLSYAYFLHCVFHLVVMLVDINRNYHVDLKNPVSKFYNHAWMVPLIKNVYITLSILYDSMGGGASLFADSLSYLKKVRGVGRYAGGEDRKTLTQRRLGGGGSISLSRSFTKVYAPSCVLGYNSCINRKILSTLQIGNWLVWFKDVTHMSINTHFWIHTCTEYLMKEGTCIHVTIINGATSSTISK